MNELINRNGMTFCMTCGCILYLAEEDIPNTRRTAPLTRRAACGHLGPGQSAGNGRWRPYGSRRTGSR